MARYGNTSLSSLLSAAQSARKKQESLEDSIAAYEWDLSEKSSEDYAKYVDHLGKRATIYQGQDPARTLEYQKKITSAQRGLASAEISRATTQILYGNMNNRQKYQTITNLFQQAAANGDENLMQRLEAQAARLSITIQNEDQAAASAGRAAGDRAVAATKRGVAKEVASKRDLIDEAKMRYESGAINYNQYADIANRAYQQMTQITTDAANNPNFDQTDIDSFQAKLVDLQKNHDFNRLASDVQRLSAQNQDGQKVKPPLRADYFNIDTGRYEPVDAKAGNVSFMGNDVSLGSSFGENVRAINKQRIMIDPVTRQAVIDPATGKPMLGGEYQAVEKYDNKNQFQQRYARVLNAASGKESIKIMGADLGIPENSALNRDAGFSPVDSKGNLMPGFEIGPDGKPIYKQPDFKAGEGFGENYGSRFSDLYAGTAKDAAGKIGGFIERNRLAREAAGFAAAGFGGPLGIAGYGMGRLGQIFGLNKLQEKVNQQKAALAVKQEQDRIARAAEFQRQSQEAQAALNNSRNAAAARPTYTKNQNIQVNAPFDPNYYTRQLNQPQRAQSAIQNVLQSPFKNNSKLPF
jgi:hypothetical protein